MVMECSDAWFIEAFVFIPARFEISKQTAFKIAVRFWEMIFRRIFHTHHYAAPIAEDRMRRCLGVEGRRVPVTSDQSWQRRKRIEMVQNDLHLSAPVLA